MKLSKLRLKMNYKKNKIITKIEYLLWVCFKVKRHIPCGRTKNTQHLCCKQPLNSKTTYLIQESKNCYCAYCKVCGSIRYLSNHPIDLDNIWTY